MSFIIRRDEEAPERLLLGPGAARARREREDVARVVEDEDGADGRGVALSGREPALVQAVEVGWVGERDDDVVLLDDLLVETVGLVAGEGERRFVHRLAGGASRPGRSSGR